MLPTRLDPVDAQIEDPSKKRTPWEWQPLDARTTKLLRCLEPLRDLLAAFKPLVAMGDADERKRFAKLNLVPLFTLAGAIRDLRNDLQSNADKELSAPAKAEIAAEYETFKAAVPTDAASALKLVRDKLGAHHDKGLTVQEQRTIWDSFELSDVARWAQAAAAMLAVLAKPNIYHWTRDTTYENAYGVMCNAGIEAVLEIQDGEVKGLKSIHLVRPPIEHIDTKIAELLRLVAELFKQLSVQ